MRYGELYTHHHNVVRGFHSWISPSVALTAVRLKQGDILFAGSGETKEEIGKCAAFVDKIEAYAGGDIVILRTRASDPIFLGYYLNTAAIVRQKSSRGQGDAVVHINSSALSDIVCKIPPLPEQHAIAEALSDMDALLVGLEKLIAKKRALKQATMQQLLTGATRLPGFRGEWEVRRLGEIGNTYGGLTGKTKNDFGHGSGLYITFLNVMSNVIINSDLFEPVQIFPNESQNRVKKGDLLFNGSSETPEEVAMCALFTEDILNLYLNSFCFGFRLRDNVQANGLFLAYYLRSGEGRELMKSLAQGSTRYNLSKTALLESAIRLPPLPEQRAIAEILSDMDAEIEALELQRKKTVGVKQGMMQELLTGRVRLV
ncbi:MAG: restriction endonuclease subunit S [Armatimonadetes bacterium]|nr:restriction endonuclease subunit S [Armatimonadota bacterium]